MGSSHVQGRYFISPAEGEKGDIAIDIVHTFRSIVAQIRVKVLADTF